MKFTKGETGFLIKNNYHIASSGDWCWKTNYPEIHKTESEIYPYKVGVEGTAYDVDGELGWCRTWHGTKSLEEAIKIK